MLRAVTAKGRIVGTGNDRLARRCKIPGPVIGAVRAGSRPPVSGPFDIRFMEVSAGSWRLLTNPYKSLTSSHRLVIGFFIEAPVNAYQIAVMVTNWPRPDHRLVPCRPGPAPGPSPIALARRLDRHGRSPTRRMAVAVRQKLALNRPLAAFLPEGGLFLLHMPQPRGRRAIIVDLRWKVSDAWRANPAGNGAKTMTDIAPVLDRIDIELDNAVDRLFDLVRIPSISTDPAYAGQCTLAADMAGRGP